MLLGTVLTLPPRGTAGWEAQCWPLGSKMGPEAPPPTALSLGQARWPCVPKLRAPGSPQQGAVSSALTRLSL